MVTATCSYPEQQPTTNLQTMATKVTEDQKRMRLEMIDFIAQAIKTQASNGYYNEEQVAYLTQQTERVAKLLGLKK